MNYLPELATIALIHFLALVSPGPDFVMIIRNAFKYSLRTAVWSAIGLGLGIGIHVFYSIVGIGFIISQSVVAFSILKFLGAAYLIFIGWKSLMAKSESKVAIDTTAKSSVDLSKIEALKMGLLTNLFNPKVTVFFVSIFSQVIDPSTPLAVKAVYGLEMSLATMVWFSFVGLIAGHVWIKSRLMRAQAVIEKVTGLVLILFGLKLAFSKR